MAQRETRHNRIEELLLKLEPSGLFIEDESSSHSGDRVESHFKIMIIAETFAGQSRLARQQTIMGLLGGEFESGLHAVHIRALTQEEHSRGLGDGFISPTCASRLVKTTKD